MNTGIQDSFNLGWKLALVQKGLAPTSLLETYTEERIPVITEMLERTTNIMNRTFKGKDHGVWLRGGSLLQLGINYRWSSIVVDEQKRKVSEEVAQYNRMYGLDDEEEYDEPDEFRSYGPLTAGRLKGGDRAPDADGLVTLGAVTPGESTRLFEIFGSSYHTVLVLSNEPNLYGPVLDALTTLPRGTIQSVVLLRFGDALHHADMHGVNYLLIDQNGHAQDAYCLREGCYVVIVRPDGFIGAITKGVEGVRRYFDGIFGAQGFST